MAGPRSRPEGVKALFDANILIDYLNGVEAARTEIERPVERLVSITWMEVCQKTHRRARRERGVNWLNPQILRVHCALRGDAVGLVARLGGS